MSVSTDQQNVNWSVYLGDSGRRHYSNLTQITPDNVDQLELAWAYDSGDLRSGNSTMYTSPLVVDGVFYGLSPTLTAFAVNAASGEELWRHDPGVPAGPQRGLMWWDHNGEQRLLYTAGRYVIALNPTDGSAVTEFGINGQLDLMPPERTGSLRVTVPGIVFDDMLIFGFSTLESDGALPGNIRAFDATDGHLLWQFNSIPKPGELGAETWADGTLENAGGANTWTGFTLDEERELLFVPTGSATPDFYGGRRHGDNLFANSVLALRHRPPLSNSYEMVIRSTGSPSQRSQGIFGCLTGIPVNRSMTSSRKQHFRVVFLAKHRLLHSQYPRWRSPVKRLN